MPTPLINALLQAKDRLEQFGAAGDSGAENALQRYYHLLRPGTVIGEALSGLLPAVEFDSWYAEARATEVSMAGSGYLEWPMEDSEAAALQLELLRRIACGDLDLMDVSHTFTYVSSYISENIGQFYRTVVVPFHNTVVRLLTPLADAEEADQTASADAQAARRTLPHDFIDKRRLSELEGLESPNHDLSRLIVLVKELDFCFRNDCLLAVAALTRTLLDHVPPIFGYRTFNEVANSHAGTKSLKDSLLHLENSARKIADAHLHTPIRRKETLPTPTQVNFSNDVDVLLSEIVRVLR
jgi:hypothetical protein